MNKIFITGDIHGNPTRFASRSFFEQKELDKSDFVIIAGNFGLIWNKMKSAYERNWLDWLDKKPFTTLFIDGNHENFDRLDYLTVYDWHGGKVHKISNSVMHLMRGEIYDIAGQKIFAFGGAPSHDINGLATPEELKENYTAGILNRSDKDFKFKVKKLNKERLCYRINHETWWKQEMPSESEMAYAWDNLEKHNFKVDYIITHDAPSSDVVLLGYTGVANKLTKFLEDVRAKCEYKHWFFGHYHENRRINDRETCIYEQIIRIV